MRITGGEAKGRKLATPKATGRDHIRPTSDRVREALFSILGNAVNGSRVLDLYAGTGSFGLDALSRGAEQSVFVDCFSEPLQLIRRNLENWIDRKRSEVIRLDLTKASAYTSLKSRFADQPGFDIIFLDPPYGKKLAETSLTMIEKTGLVAAKGVVIAEERWKADLPGRIGTLHLRLHRRYGETGIWIYEPVIPLDNND